MTDADRDVEHAMETEAASESPERLEILQSFMHDTSTMPWGDAVAFAQSLEGPTLRAATMVFVAKWGALGGIDDALLDPVIDRAVALASDRLAGTEFEVQTRVLVASSAVRRRASEARPLATALSTHASELARHVGHTLLGVLDADAGRVPDAVESLARSMVPEQRGPLTQEPARTELVERIDALGAAPELVARYRGWAGLTVG